MRHFAFVAAIIGLALTSCAPVSEVPLPAPEKIEALAFFNQGYFYQTKGQLDRAIQDYDEALRLDPGFLDALTNRGITYEAKGQFDRAIQDYDEAIRLNPDYAFAFLVRGKAFAKKGEYDHAIQDFDMTLRLDPGMGIAYQDKAFVLNEKAWKLATARNANDRDGREAIQLAEQAISQWFEFYNELPAPATFHDTLASAYAEASQYADAVREQQRAIELLRSEGEQDEAPDFENRLRLYQQGRPYRE